KYELIEYLYDSRILHIIKQGISALDRPGERFNAYSIDYGGYVDLINTVKAPKGLMLIGGEFIESPVNVPANDYRSIRRAILDIEKFYTNLSS
ncbi:MAG: hypothetical protein AAFP00_14650, partial [Bacteroidota bacterium]